MVSLRVPVMAAVVATSMVAGTVSLPASAAMRAEGDVAVAADAEISIRKEVSRTSIQPGQELQYTLTASCSSLTTPCLDMVVTDVLPAEFQVSSLPQSNSQREVAFDPNTRVLTVTYRIPVPGGTGMPAGATQQINVGMRLPTQTPVTDGTVITNTAEVAASNADPRESAVDVTAQIPVNYEPVATKNWNPNTAVAKSQSISEVTLGIRNASTTSARVKELIVTDTSQATFDRFDLQASAGEVATVTQFPAGADQVYVDVCLLPIGTPCGDGDWVTAGPFTSGTFPFVLPAPSGDMSSATGIRLRYSSSAGDDLPYSSTQGLANLSLKLRDTLRSNGVPIEPPSRLKVTNCAAPSLLDDADRVETGSNACKDFFILPGTVSLAATKSIFPDSNGTFSSNGHIVVGRDSGVSMVVTATNRSEFDIGVITITEPSDTASHEFDKIDATNARLTWPAGATSATLAVTCRSGSDPAPAVYSRPGGSNPTTNVTSLGCDAGVYPERIAVTFTGLGQGNTPLMPPGASGALAVHGDATRVTQADVADQLRNCADAEAELIPGGTSSAVAQACSSTPVENPAPGFGSGVKTSNGVSSMTLCRNPPQPGDCEPVSFRIGFRNNGNVPLTNVVITDGQSDPVGSPAPFDKVRLDQLILPASPAADAEVWDPTSGAGGAYVPYDGGDSALLARATGFRVTLTGDLPIGQRFDVTAKVLARSDVTPGDTFTNCASISLGSNSREVCSNAVAIGEPNNNAQLEKLIVPGQVVRPAPGLPPQTAQVRQVINTAANGGNMPLKRLVTTDIDADFFDAVTFAGNLHVNFPVGANRVRIDACTSTSDCQADTWVTGTPTSSSTPGLPVGVTAANVKGIRVTFTHSSGGYNILPSNQIPTSAQCPNANVCFDVTVKSTLPADVDLLENTISGAGESPLQQPGQTFPIPDVTAPLSIVAGTAQLAFDKTPNSRIGPGDTAPINLKATNTGTSLLVDPVIVDPLPAALTAVPGVGGAAPYTITYNNLPNGYPRPTTVTYREIRGDPTDPPAPGCTDINRVCTLSWEFPGYQLPVGASIQIQFNVELTPGTLAQEVISNVAGASAANPALSCKNPAASQTGYPYGTGLFCLDGAEVTSLSGNDFKGEKWIKADPALGFLNASGQVVDVDDPQCPQYFLNGEIYTRYPCVARVLPGQRIDYLIRGVNSGTNPATEIVILDGLPVEGDNGVKLTTQQRGTQWDNRPTMASPVVNVEGYPGVTTGYTDAGYMTNGFCRNGIKEPPGDACPPNSFDAQFGPANTGFQTTLTFPVGERLDPGESFTLTWSMTAPLDLTSLITEPIAWNSFAYRPSFIEGSTVRVLPATEPLKVGVAMPMETFTVDKDVVGLPQGVTVPPYQMAYRCTITTESAGEQQVASGTFQVTGGDSWTSPYIPASAVCYVWETNAQGGTSDNIGEENAAAIEIVSGQDNRTTITNSYESGELTFSKTVTWDNVAPVPVGDFDFELSCGFPTPGDTLPGFPTTFSLSDGDDTTFTDLPVGTSCQVTETGTQNATKVLIKPSNQAPTEGPTATIGVSSAEQGGTDVEVENIYQTGGILIEKRLVGDGSAWAAGPFEFDVTCTTPDYSTTVTLDPGQLSATVSPIVAGSECTVTETSGGNAATPLPAPQTVTIPPYTGTPPGPVETTFTNQFPVNLRLTKTLSGAARDYAQGPFTFEIDCTPTQVPDPLIVTLTPDFLVADVTGLPIGGQCSVVETGNGGASAPTVPHQVGTFTVPGVNDPPAELTVDNEFPEGRVRVSKTLSGDAAVRMTDAEFTIALTCERDLVSGGTEQILDRTVRLKGGEASTWSAGLPVGARCWAAETDSQGATTVTISHDETNPITITDGQRDADITVDNNYPAGGDENGSLVITKELRGEARQWAQGPFVFRTACSLGDFSLPAVQSILTPSDREAAIGNLPVGAFCVVSETGVGSASVPEPNVLGVVTVPDASTQSVPVGPTYVPAVNDFPAGYLTVRKELAGQGAAAMGAARFALDVRCERDLIAGGTEEILARQVTLAGGESMRFDDPLPMGARCWATETDSVGATSVSVDHGRTSPVTIGESDPEVSVTAVNTYDAGAIKLVKTLSGGAARYAEGPFDFTVDCTIGGVDTPRRTVSLTPANLSATVSGLPVGAVCAVHEVSAGNASVATPRLVATVTIPSGGTDPVVVEVDNPFPAGRVTVAKKVTGGAASLTDRARFRLRVTCEYDSQTILRKTVSLKGGATKTLRDPLPVGTVCWGAERGDTGAARSRVSPGRSSAATPVTEERPAVTVTATNTFPAGTLQVRKEVKGAGPRAGFGFAVSCRAGVGQDRWRVDLARRHRKFLVRADTTQKVTGPRGSDCVVKETKDRRADKTIYSKTKGKKKDRGQIEVKKSGLLLVTNVYPGGGAK